MGINIAKKALGLHKLNFAASSWERAQSQVQNWDQICRITQYDGNFSCVILAYL